MNDLQLFQNEQFGQLRCHIDENGVTWFCAKDMSTALEYNPEPKVGMIFQNVPDEWKGVKPIYTPGGTQEMLCLTEQGLYFFLGRSDKPRALPYQKWVAGEIIPSIRRTGGYLAVPAEASPEEILARAVLVADDTIKRLKEKTVALEIKVESDRPKVIFAEAVQASPKCILVHKLARYLKQNGVDIGQNRLFDYLRDNGYLIKARGLDYNQPTQKSMDLGLFEVSKAAITHSDGRIEPKTTTRVTGRGQQYFLNKFLTKLKLVAA